MRYEPETLPLSHDQISLVQANIPTWFPKPAVITREEWAAEKPPPVSDELKKCNVFYIVIHHTHSAPKEGDVPPYLRAVEREHVKRRLGGLAYRALIAPDGKIYEGFRRRSEGDGYALEGGVSSQHARHFNCGSYGIALLGNYDELPFSVSLPVGRSLLETILYVATQERRTLLQYDVCGNLVIDTVKIIGHRETGKSKTECPGSHVFAALPALRERVCERLCQTIQEHIQKITGHPISVHMMPGDEDFD